VKKGAPFETVAAEGDGPERARGGDFGLIARGDLPDRDLERAAFALASAGDVSALVETHEGVALVQLVERRPARLPSFEEARQRVTAKMQPERKRKAFDALIAELRKKGDVHINEVALR
jgi:parvulin-like peptidyl-prolyl isomerase